MPPRTELLRQEALSLVRVEALNEGLPLEHPASTANGVRPNPKLAPRAPQASLPQLRLKTQQGLWPTPGPIPAGPG